MTFSSLLYGNSHGITDSGPTPTFTNMNILQARVALSTSLPTSRRRCPANEPTPRKKDPREPCLVPCSVPIIHLKAATIKMTCFRACLACCGSVAATMQLDTLGPSEQMTTTFLHLTSSASWFGGNVDVARRKTFRKPPNVLARCTVTRD